MRGNSGIDDLERYTFRCEIDSRVADSVASNSVTNHGVNSVTE
jgi:hypothetical protein